MASQQSISGTMPPQQQHVQSTHPFTCNSCQVAFRSSELQRAHMQTDWHRYNLKRRVASLPPLSSEIFAEKVLANKASAAATAAKASFEKCCVACQKTYYSENAYTNHLNSQKHKATVSKVEKATRSGAHNDETASMMSSAFSLGEPMNEPVEKAVDDEAEEEFSKVVEGIKGTSLEEDDETDPLSRRPTRPHHSAATDRPDHPLSRTQTDSSRDTSGRASAASSARPPQDPLLNCLFCNFASPTFTLNIHHMGRFHGMFIPEQEYLVDPEGLIKFLYQKIDEEHECLYCGKSVHTTSGIQTHMRDRGHCMIAFNSEAEMLEIGDYYDFSSTYSDPEGSEDDSDASESTTGGGGVKLGAARQTSTTIDDHEMTGADDEGWETDSTLSSVPTDEITAVPIDDRSHRYKLLNKSRHHSHGDPRPHRAKDGWHSHAHTTPVAVYHDDYELHLPSGRTAGHRSLNRYYRQNLRNYPGVAERMEQQQQRTITAGTSDSDGDVNMDGNNNNRGRQLITRGNGGLGMVGVSDTKKAEVRAVEKRERRREQRARNKYQAGNEKRGNFQKHFRDPLLQ